MPCGMLWSYIMAVMDSINLRCSKVIIRYLRGSWCCDNCNSSHSKFQAVAIRNNLKKKSRRCRRGSRPFSWITWNFQIHKKPTHPYNKKTEESEEPDNHPLEAYRAIWYRFNEFHDYFSKIERLKYKFICFFGERGKESFQKFEELYHRYSGDLQICMRLASNKLLSRDPKLKKN